MRTLKSRVLSAADIMIAEKLAKASSRARIAKLELSDLGENIALPASVIGIEEFSTILLGMLTETEGE